MKAEDETLDAFYHGRIKILQKIKGYRFALDAPLLADFIRTTENDELLEFGTGNGIVSLLLSIHPFKHITAVEVQASLAELARKNIKLNHLEKRIKVVEQDLLQFRTEKKYDIIFSNPPYHKKDEGHLSLSKEKSIAKHELKCTIFDIMQKTSAFLKRKGRAYFVFPEKRKDDIEEAVKMNGLKMKSRRAVFAHKKARPNLFLVEVDFFSRGVNQQPDLILYDSEGEYTQETKEIFAGRLHASSLQ
ncbi:MAG: methyltransferase [Candidatus Aminicenantes bacterium]|nr:methyltransferase [Candidatus Aminicenantes bacterium]